MAAWRHSDTVWPIAEPGNDLLEEQLSSEQEYKTKANDHLEFQDMSKSLIFAKHTFENIPVSSVSK